MLHFWLVLNSGRQGHYYNFIVYCSEIKMFENETAEIISDGLVKIIMGIVISHIRFWSNLLMPLLNIGSETQAGHCCSHSLDKVTRKRWKTLAAADLGLSGHHSQITRFNPKQSFNHTKVFTKWQVYVVLNCVKSLEWFICWNAKGYELFRPSQCFNPIENSSLYTFSVLLHKMLYIFS